MPKAQVDQFCSLLRWFNLMQHTAAKGSAFTVVPIPAPRYVPPPPPAPPAAPAASASQAKSGKQEAASAAPSTNGAAAAPAKGKPAPAEATSSSTSGAAAAADGATSGKKDKKADKKAAAAAAGSAAAAAGAAAAATAKGGKEEEEPRIDMLDIRVGQIVKVQRHPNADALYLEEIDLGDDAPRQVGVRGGALVWGVVTAGSDGGEDAGACGSVVQAILSGRGQPLLMGTGLYKQAHSAHVLPFSPRFKSPSLSHPTPFGACAGDQRPGQVCAGGSDAGAARAGVLQPQASQDARCHVLWHGGLRVSG